MKPGPSVVIGKLGDSSLYHVIVAPQNFGNWTSRIKYITLYSSPLTRIITLNITVGKIFKESDNATIYLIDSEIPPHSYKTVLDFIVKVIPIQGTYPVPKLALVTFADTVYVEK